jgi:electron transport complex protein RnfD
MTSGSAPNLDRARPVPEPFVAAWESPYLRAPEEVATIYRVTMAAALLPLLGGVVLFGWRAAVVTAISVATCAAMERLYYWVTRSPALLGRSHAYLTGLLLAMTLPAAVPLYVPVVAGAFAIIVGKAIFGGVGHFLWQPALVGRLAVAVFFASTLNPSLWPVLAEDKLFWGDAAGAGTVADFHQWQDRLAPEGKDAMLLEAPTSVLSGLTRPGRHRFSALGNLEANFSEMPRPAPTLMSVTQMPPMLDMLLGARGGGVGETPILLLILGGLYLIYRNYVKWQLPLSMLAAAAAVAIVAPIRLAGPGDSMATVWWPATAEDSDVGLLYVCYQLFCGGLVLAAFFLATEMTSRPVTTRGQVVFGAGCGTLAMLLQLYVDTPIPAFIAVLVMNTFTPVIEAICRPRVLGASRFPWRRRPAYSQR